MGRPATTTHRAGQRARMAAATLAPVAAPLLTGDCSHCGAELADEQGNPRWDVVAAAPWFICVGGCRG